MSTCIVCCKAIYDRFDGEYVLLTKGYAHNKCVNTKPYKFVDFSPKASSDSADKSYMSDETLTHNED